MTSPPPDARAAHAAHPRGPSSFGLHDPAQVFEALGLRPGDFLVDIGCGPGEYSLAAAEIVGPAGRVIALDKSQKSVEQLRQLAVSRGISNLKPVAADITLPLPLTDRCAQACLIATVLHIIRVNHAAKALFKECHRILDSKGRLSIIECKKEEQPWGPPLELRIAPQEIEAVVVDYGFDANYIVDLGKTYLIQFSKA